VQELYLESLTAIGIDLRQHDIKFEEDNWESPTLGAWGIGWQVMLDGLEITQFTYFQQCGGVDLEPISAELTYGLERIAAFLQDVDSVYDIVWARDPGSGKAVTYGNVRLADELQFSVYNFEAADVDKAWKHLELCESECQALLQRFRERQKEDGKGAGKAAARPATAGSIPEEHDFSEPLTAEPQNGFVDAGSLSRFPLLPAYDLCLKCSHLFNVLDARGAISVTERVGVIARIRNLAVGIAKAWIEQQKAASEASKPAEKAREQVTT
jgi:glycyl-tRNA synthetase alpha chain